MWPCLILLYRLKWSLLIEQMEKWVDVQRPRDVMCAPSEGRFSHPSDLQRCSLRKESLGHPQWGLGDRGRTGRRYHPIPSWSQWWLEPGCRKQPQGGKWNLTMRKVSIRPGSVTNDSQGFRWRAVSLGAWGWGSSLLGQPLWLETLWLGLGVSICCIIKDTSSLCPGILAQSF